MPKDCERKSQTLPTTYSADDLLERAGQSSLSSFSMFVTHRPTISVRATPRTHQLPRVGLRCAANGGKQQAKLFFSVSLATQTVSSDSSALLLRPKKLVEAAFRTPCRTAWSFLLRQGAPRELLGPQKGSMHVECMACNIINGVLLAYRYQRRWRLDTLSGW